MNVFPMCYDEIAVWLWIMSDQGTNLNGWVLDTLEGLIVLL